MIGLWWIFYAYNFLKSKNIQTEILHQKISKLEDTLQIKEKVLFEKEEESKRYKDILMASGTLYSLEFGNKENNLPILQVDGFDIVRFVNVSKQMISLEIYDNKDMSWESLRQWNIPASDFIIFSLKKSGWYWYRSGNRSWAIHIGNYIDEDITPKSFLEKQILPLIQKEDPNTLNTALIKFKEEIHISPEVSKKCHDLAHAIGHEAFDIFGFAVSISHAGEDICAGGYTHGILEHYFLSDTTLADHPEDVCTTITDISKGSCFHGVWHGLMFVYSDDITKSLEKCRTLSTDIWKNRCAEGVFMELYSGDPRHAGWVIKYSTWNLFLPCEESGTGSESYVCGFYAWLWYLRYASEDYGGALDACQKWGKYKNMCFKGVGREVAKRYMGDALKLENICTYSLSENEGISCIEGGINYTALQYDTDTEFMKRYCINFSKPLGICKPFSEETSISISQESDSVLE